MASTDGAALSTAAEYEKLLSLELYAREQLSDDSMTAATLSCPVSPTLSVIATTDDLPSVAPCSAGIKGLANTMHVDEADGQPRIRPYTMSMSQWSFEEDQALLQGIAHFGKRWKKIAEHIPHRTEAMCRNRFIRMEAPRRPEMKGYKVSKNRCNYCGALKKGHSCKAKAETFIVNSARNVPFLESAAVPISSSRPSLMCATSIPVTTGGSNGPRWPSKPILEAEPDAPLTLMQLAAGESGA